MTNTKLKSAQNKTNFRYKSPFLTKANIYSHNAEMDSWLLYIRISGKVIYRGLAAQIPVTPHVGEQHIPKYQPPTPGSLLSRIR